LDRALLALCALILNAALAGPRRWHDALGTARLQRIPIQFLRDIERRLNREHRSARRREKRGLLLVAVTVAVCLFMGWLLHLLFQRNLGFVEIIIVAALLPMRQSWDIASGIRKHLQAGDIASARFLLEGTAWRHHALLDEHGLARAAIEILVINFAQKILGGIFWYMLLGLPGLFTTCVLNLMREHMPRPLGGEQDFGRGAEQLHALLHFVPSRLSALLWVGVSLFLPSGKWKEAYRVLVDSLTRAAPGALSLRIAGIVLEVQLGGPSSIYTAGWEGSGTARPGASDIRRALYLFALLHLLLFIGLGLLL
jgi:adenosylcobinamide-phosphate synthase